MNICIAGVGGLAREVLVCLKDFMKHNTTVDIEDICFMEKDEFLTINSLEGIPIIPQSSFNANTHHVILAIGDVSLRKKIANDLPKNTKYATIVHSSAIVSEDSILGKGSVVMAGSVISCNVKIGDHSIIDRLATIGHDCIVDDFFHLAPGSVLSGNISIGKEVYIGTKAALKENITVCNQVVIGMGAIVTKNIKESGTYVGVPARKI